MIFIGQIIFGYTDGSWGDEYGDKRIEAFGYDWIVARNEKGQALFASFSGNAEMLEHVSKYSSAPKQDEG